MQFLEHAFDLLDRDQTFLLIAEGVLAGFHRSVDLFDAFIVVIAAFAVEFGALAENRQLTLSRFTRSRLVFTVLEFGQQTVELGGEDAQFLGQAFGFRAVDGRVESDQDIALLDDLSDLDMDLLDDGAFQRLHDDAGIVGNDLSLSLNDDIDAEDARPDQGGGNKHHGKQHAVTDPERQFLVFDLERIGLKFNRLRRDFFRGGSCYFRFLFIAHSSISGFHLLFPEIPVSAGLLKQISV